MINIIVAYDLNMGIGKDNKLLWHNKNDMRRFKRLTENCSVVMGRKTYESIGKLLPNRHNIILTSNKELEIIKSDNATYEIINNPASILNRPEEIWVIGGQSLYEYFLPYSENIYATEIDEEFLADTYFPYIDMDDFDKVKSYKKEGYSFTFYKKRE